MTNFERIKQMSVEELGDLLDAIQFDALLTYGDTSILDYPKGMPGEDFEKWLESEVDE